MKKWIRVIAGNSYLYTFLGVIVALTGLLKIAETLQDDFVNCKFRSGHGVVLIGVWHLLQSLSEIIEASDYLDEGLE